MLAGGWLLPGLDPVDALSTRQLNRAIHAAAEAAHIDKRVSTAAMMDAVFDRASSAGISPDAVNLERFGADPQGAATPMMSTSKPA